VQVDRGGGQRTVPHRSLDRHEIHTGGGEQRPVRVPQIMQSQRAQARGVASTLEAAPQSPAVKRPSELVHEHEVFRRREVLPPADPVERGGCLVRERDAADLSRLRRGLHTRAHRAFDGQRVAGEVDVAPAQREQLAKSQAGIACDAHKLGVLMVLSLSLRRLGNGGVARAAGRRPRRCAMKSR
jgi:hypothetical protein